MRNAVRFLGAPFSSAWTNRSLIAQMAKREVLGRYKGANFGVLWSLISPFLLLVVYTFAFGTVMRGHWPQVEAGDTSFSIVLFSGLIVHGLLADVLNRSPNLVTAHTNLVKRVIFPVEILPWALLISSCFHTAANVLVFVLLRFVMDGRFDLTIVLLPIVLLPLAVLTLGIAWFLSALSVYVKDLNQLIGVVSIALLFLSSAMMPLDSVPEQYRWVFLANPLTFIIDQSRAVMLWGVMPNWSDLLLYLVAASGFAYGGLAFFKAASKGFSDVL
jgi:lipopolysaccharide transport system permease protein